MLHLKAVFLPWDHLFHCVIFLEIAFTIGNVLACTWNSKMSKSALKPRTSHIRHKKWSLKGKGMVCFNFFLSKVKHNLVLWKLKISIDIDQNENLVI